MSVGLYDRIENDCLVLGTALAALQISETERGDHVISRVLLRAAELDGYDRAEMNELLRHGGSLLVLLGDPT